MLILTRKVGQTIIIDEHTYLTVYGVKGNQVRLGFDAPAEISILRQELFERNQLEEVNKNRLIRPNVIYR